MNTLLCSSEFPSHLKWSPFSTCKDGMVDSLTIFSLQMIQDSNEILFPCQWLAQKGPYIPLSQWSIRGSLPGITDGWSLGKPYPWIALKISFHALEPFWVKLSVIWASRSSGMGDTLSGAFALLKLTVWWDKYKQGHILSMLLLTGDRGLGSSLNVFLHSNPILLLGFTSCISMCSLLIRG